MAPGNQSFRSFDELLIVFSTKVNLLYRLYSSTSDKAKQFSENIFKNPDLDDSGFSLPIFSSSTNLKLQKISVTLKMVKKVITNFDLSKATGLDFISVVVLENCASQLSYMLAELFNICLKESCFPNCWKVSSVIPVLKNVRETSVAKRKVTALLVFFHWLLKSCSLVVSKNL